MTGMLDRFRVVSAQIGEKTAGLLGSEITSEWFETVAVRPPRDTDGVASTLPRFVHEIMELQTRLFGLRNASPVTVFEIRRVDGEIRLQFAAETQRVLRKIRLHLSEAVPGVGFDNGVSGVPVEPGDTVSGGLLALGRPDMFPLDTGFERPPTDNVVAALHRDAHPGEQVVIQVLFRPAAGRPVREWLWRRKAFKRVGWLKKEKHSVVPWRDRPPTKIERQQADAVEAKARNPQFHVGIRFLFVGTRPAHVRSRVKEVAGAFNVFESRETNQYLDAHTVTAWNEDGITEFAEAVAYRWFDSHLFRFRLGIPELAGLVAVPTGDHGNVRRAEP